MNTQKNNIDYILNNKTNNITSNKDFALSPNSNLGNDNNLSIIHSGTEKEDNNFSSDSDIFLSSKGKKENNLDTDKPLQEQNRINIQATYKQPTSNQGATSKQTTSEKSNILSNQENLKPSAENKDIILIPEQTKKPPLKTLDYKIICKSILKCNGNIAEIAKDLNYNYSNVYQFLKNTKNNTIKRVLEQSREIVLDIAESKLIEHINSIDPRISLDAVKFTLSTLGKNRGFTNKQEIALSQDVLTVPDFEQLRQLKQDFTEVLKIDIEQNFIDNQEINLNKSDSDTINND
jgi:hypothetical protein